MANKQPLHVSFKDNILTLDYGGADIRQYYLDDMSYTGVNVWRKMPGMKAVNQKEYEFICELMATIKVKRKTKPVIMTNTEVSYKGGCMPIIALLLCLSAMILLTLN